MIPIRKLPRRAFRRFHRQHHVAATRETLENLLDLVHYRRIEKVQKEKMLAVREQEQKRARTPVEKVSEKKAGFVSKALRFFVRRRS
jgi:hypothetical protein